jgi:hypothetical protein
MKTLTVKIGEELDAELAALATQRGETKSTLVRAAIEQMLGSGEVVSPGSCLALSGDLVGSVDGHHDLSHNKNHLEDYGK